MYTRRAERESGVPVRQTVGVDFQLATATFRGNKNLNLSGYYVWTTGLPNVPGHAARGMRAEYPNDLWLARVAFLELQAGYDPAVGFVDRVNIRRYNPEIYFAPRPKNNRFVRRLVFRTDHVYITDLENRLSTRIIETGFHVDFHSGDGFQFYVFPTYERLDEDFEISPGVILPNGIAYNFTRYHVQVSTASRRVVSMTANYEIGSFYTGDRRDFILNLDLRPRAGVLINLSNEWNRVELREGNFSTSLLRLNANNQFNPWISIGNDLQYDTVTRILGWQMRFRWILRPGNDIFFVYAHNWLDDLTRGRYTFDRSAATKIVYTHQF
jgi:hypothetical protein